MGIAEMGGLWRSAEGEKIRRVGLCAGRKVELNMSSHIRLVNVTKRFGSVVAVDRLNLEIEKGECFSLLGPSGCGKTTTLRMVAGFEDLDEGEIHVGERLFSSSHKKYYLPPEKRDFGMVFQAFAVWPHLNVFENVAFPLQIKKLSRSEILERTRRALEHTGLMKAEASFPECPFRRPDAADRSGPGHCHQPCGHASR